MNHDSNRTEPGSPRAQIARRYSIPIAAAAAILAGITLSAPLTRLSEGKRNVAYVDLIGKDRPATTCFGHTGPQVRVGARYSDAECEALLEGDQVEHAVGVYRCTPRIAGDVHALAAATDFAFNVGVRAYCGSTAARRFRVGDFVGGCRALGPSFAIVGANGRVRTVRGYVLSAGKARHGLVIRRDRDASLCLTGKWK